jgi:hypothetical protein
VLALVARRRGLVPGGVCLPDASDFRAVVTQLSARPTRVDLSGWAALPPSAIEVRDLRIRRVAVDGRALALLAGLLAADPRGIPCPGPLDPGPLRALAAPLTRAALAGDGPAVARLLDRLVGAGPGATPAGDDVTTGVLAALAAADRTGRARQLLGTQLRPLLPRTTTLARADLVAALHGEFAEHVHQLLAALADPGEVPAAVAEARIWGATSGVDLATGMAAALACLTAAPIGRLTAPPPSIPSTTDTRRSA